MLHFGAGRKYPRKLIADYISSMSFTVPLTSSAVLSRGFGAGSYTRATTATIDDHESVVRYCLSGEARFKKSRRVRNWLGNSYDMTTAGGWASTIAGTGIAATCTAGQIAPDGTATAFRITADRGAGTTSGDYSYWNSPTVVGIGQLVARDSLWIKSNTGISQNVGLRIGGITSSHIVVATSEWRRVCDVPTNTGGTAGGSVSNIFAIGCRGNVATDRAIDVLVWHPQIEVVGGQSNEAPAAYVSNGAPKLNELIQTQDFDSASWPKTQASITANAVTAPDGTLTADKLIDTAVAGIHAINQVGTTSVGNTETLSAYFKAAEKTWAAMQLGSTTVAYYNLSDGTLGTVTAGTATITPVGNGWYRCTLTGTRLNTNTLLYVANGNGAASYTGDGVSGIYVWGAQITQGSSAGTYYPVGNVYHFHGAMVDGVKYFDTTNGNTVNSNVVTEAAGTPLPRAGRGYLPEDSKINLCLQSNAFTTTWVPTNLTPVQNVTSPDGSANGWTFTESVDGGITSHQCVQSVTVSNTTVYSFSVWLKKGVRTEARLALVCATTVAAGLFDLNAGTVGSINGSASIASYPNGWYRCTITGTSDSTSASLQIFSKVAGLDYIGNGSIAFYGFGAQLEVGDVISTYIPTTTASVTRNADTLTYPAAGNAGTSGTLFVECGPSPVANLSFVSLLTVSDGTTNNYNGIQNNAANARAFMSSGGVSQGNGNGVSWVNGTSAKIAARFGANTIQFAKDGVLATEDTVASIPVSVDLVSIGQSSAGTARANMPIQMVGISPKLFNDLQLIQSTN